MSMFKWFLCKVDIFVLLLLLMIVLAWFAPCVGVDNGVFVPSDVANWGVVVVFFMYGVKLSRNNFVDGVRNVKLHALVQGTTFLLFPLLVLMVIYGFGMGDNMSMLWLGIFFVAALPSTVSSSVVMVSIARGNVGAAIFDASLSSLLGIVLTPVWMSIFLTTDMGAVGFGDVVLKLIVQVVLPVGIGMTLNSRMSEWVQRHKVGLKWCDQGVILAIVYTSFCEGFYDGIFDGIGWGDLGLLIVGMGLLFGIVYGIITLISGVIGFNREDKIVALFCGSKKSLVHGTVISKVLISDRAAVGVMILPIMVYHALQLVIVSVIATKKGREKI